VGGSGNEREIDLFAFCQLPVISRDCSAKLLEESGQHGFHVGSRVDPFDEFRTMPIETESAVGGGNIHAV
jgi:hypothetical protein